MRRASLGLFRGYLEFFIFINVILSNTWMLDAFADLLRFLEEYAYQYGKKNI
jgi:hypothetical protein